MSDAVGLSAETAWLWLVRPIGPKASALSPGQIRGRVADGRSGLLPAPPSATLPTRPIVPVGAVGKTDPPHEPTPRPDH